MNHSDTIDAGNALMRQLAEDAGRVSMRDASFRVFLNISRLHAERQLGPELFVLPGSTAEHGRTRPIIIPSGWYEAHAVIRDVAGLVLSWRTWAVTRQRAKAKAIRKVLAYGMREHAAGRWPS